MPTLTPGFGLKSPEGTTHAYGCRAIAHRGAYDLPHDRQSYTYETQDSAREFIEDMNARVGKHVVNLAQEAEMAGELPRDEEPHVIFDDGEFIVTARLAGGYCYIGAWRRSDVPEASE